MVELNLIKKKKHEKSVLEKQEDIEEIKLPYGEEVVL
jgi:hypothetical protein